jgi:3-hydroxybutyryl-CoA dehydratase
MTKNEQKSIKGIRYFDEISEGMSAKISRIIGEEDIVAFAEVTGDKNPIHLDVEYAASSIFGQRICHGMLVAGLISAVFGCHFPGNGWVYVNQSLQFRGPVFIGEEVTITVTVKKLIFRKQLVEFGIIASVEKKKIITGVATLMSPKRYA